MEKMKIENFKLPIETVGDELVFQKTYYNYKYADEKIILSKSNLNFDNDLTEKVAQKYTELTGIELKRTKENYPKGFSYDTLRNIENCNVAKDKYNHKNREVLSLDNYYLTIFCMFKVYNFLDDYDIFKILEKYHINPKNDEMEKKIKLLKQNCMNEYQTKNSKTPISLMNENDIIYTIYFKNYNFFNSKMYKINKNYTRRFFNSEIPINPNNIEKVVKELRKIMLNQFKTLSSFDRKYTSLELGKETCFIDDVLDNKIEFITIETMLRILNYLKLEDSDIYYFLKLISNKSKFSPDDELNIFEKTLKRH